MFSTGGDEVNLECYADDLETQQILNSTGQTLDQALNTFTQSTHGALTKLGKVGVIKEGETGGCISYSPACAHHRVIDMVLDHNLTLTSDTVVM